MDQQTDRKGNVLSGWSGRKSWTMFRWSEFRRHVQPCRREARPVTARKESKLRVGVGPGPFLRRKGVDRVVLGERVVLAWEGGREHGRRKKCPSWRVADVNGCQRSARKTEGETGSAGGCTISYGQWGERRGGCRDHFWRRRSSTFVFSLSFGSSGQGVHAVYQQSARARASTVPESLRADL